MKRVKQNGFVLVLVIAIISLIGVEMFVLAGSSNIILFQTNDAYLEACEQNLAASGLAWAEKNIKNEKGDEVGYIKRDRWEPEKRWNIIRDGKQTGTIKRDHWEKDKWIIKKGGDN